MQVVEVVPWDVWALAVIAYEMLAGALPFGGIAAADSQSAVLAGRPTPIRTVPPEAPVRVQALFARALSPDAAERPRGAEAFATELGQAVGS